MFTVPVHLRLSFLVASIAVGFFVLYLCGVISVPVAAAQSSGSLPIAITVPVLGTSGAGGELVVYNLSDETYTISQGANLPNVFGVTADRPPLLFITASNTVPVITYGSAYLKVDNTRGRVTRGDLLVSGVAAGTAAKASLEDEEVFALALEDAGPGVTTILVQFDPNGAKALAAERRKEAEEAAAAAASGLFGTRTGEDGEEEPGLLRRLFEEYTRGTLAAIIAIGSLFFIMYTFRTTIINATLAVGRNPRAKSAIMTVSIENLVFAFIIFGVAIFIAIAVLVLPI